LSLRALSIGTGDEVVVPAFTCRAVPDAVRAAGATPTFADVVWPPGTVSASSIERVVTRRTRAVILVDVYGAPSPVEAAAEVTRCHDLTLIVDVAQSFGARLDPGGDIVLSSFHPSKVLAAGEGGVVLTRRHDVAERVRYLRSPGALEVRLGHTVDGGSGRSMRMSDLDAALARSRLDRIGSVLSDRRTAARRWLDAFELIGRTISHPDPSEHSFSTMAVRVDPACDRRFLLDRLRTLGVRATTGYRPLHLRQAGVDPCPVATLLGDTLICLPTRNGIGGRHEIGDDQRLEAVSVIAGCSAE
jgi:dTDP-4-amino-4,6-dideoxygalactose transaminase